MTTSNVAEDVEQLDVSQIAVKVSNAATTLENSLIISYKSNIHLCIDQAIPLIGTSLREMKT